MNPTQPVQPNIQPVSQAKAPVPVTPDIFKQMLQSAIKNPTNPAAGEFQKRLISGNYNSQITAIGLKPEQFGYQAPVQTPAPDEVHGAAGGQGLFGDGSSLFSSEKGVGETLGQSLAVNTGKETGDLEASRQGLSDTVLHITKMINEDKAAGKDTTALQTALDRAKSSLTHGSVSENAPATTKTDAEAGGELLGTAADVLTAGVGAEAKGASTAAKSLSLGKNAINAAKITAEGAGTGYAQDVASNLQQGKTGAEAATPGLGTAIGAAVPIAGAAIKSVPRFLTVAGNATNPIEENVKHALTNPQMAEESAQTLDRYLDIAKTAVNRTGEMNPVEVAAKEQFGQAIPALKAKLQAAGEAKDAALETVASKKLDGVDKVFEDLQQDTSKRTGAIFNGLLEQNDSVIGKSAKQSYSSLKDSMDGANMIPDEEMKGQFSSAPGRTHILDGTEQKKLGGFFEGIQGLQETPTIQKANDFIDKWQAELHKSNQVGAVPLNSKVEGVMKSALGRLNELTKEAAGPAYKASNEEYARIKPVFDDLNKEVGENYSNSARLLNQVFAPSVGQGAKDLISKVEKETGLPIFHNATLARFAMKVAGDPNAEGTLKAALQSGSKLGTLKAIIDKISRPEAQARRIAEQAGRKARSK